MSRQNQELVAGGLTVSTEQCAPRTTFSAVLPNITRSIPESNQRIELFLKLFRCRASVYPKRWENATKNASGY